MNNSVQYMVSVRLMTFNHDKFIKKAMDGIMMQKTSFSVEVIVGDDFSVDRTLSIINEYSDTENIHIKVLDRPLKGEYLADRQKYGRLYNFENILDNCTGKYTALLDGDDYWIDPNKLNDQVNFLENNKDYAGVCHNANIVYENWNSAYAVKKAREKG